MPIKSVAFCAFTITLISLRGACQDNPDITGYWNGVAEVSLAQDILVQYYFEQEGSLLSGFSTGKSMNLRDSSKSKFVGSLSQQSVDLKGTEFIYKAGPGCLSNITLTYSKENEVEKLSGSWFGDWNIATCMPGSKRRLELVKVSLKEPTISLNRPEDKATLSALDDFTTSMINELSERIYYALIIGINNYQDETINNLDHPVADAQFLRETLHTYYTFVEPFTTTLLNPSRDEIIEAFDGLSERITAKDQLLIFYAGHGIWDERMQQGYWLPSDATKNSKARWLSNSTIRNYIGGIRSKHTLLITDACFSGGIFKERGVDFQNSRAMLQLYKMPSRKAMTSGTLTTVPDKSVFIQYLIKNLQQNADPCFPLKTYFETLKLRLSTTVPMVRCLNMEQSVRLVMKEVILSF
ncbi:MAG: caspase family protein [Bacteroidetes bacterium]|nr:caspase family protein [Bacteroidota bacterium]MDA1121362.1 caspase family protein [Bacteroidota bacterium]